MAGVCEKSIDLQEKEIDTVKSSLDGQVRVIAGIGDFTNVVTIHPDGLDLHCKFQLTENYPQTPPTISIRSSVLNPDQIADLISSLQTEATSKVGHTMLLDLMMSCKRWLFENDVDVCASTIAEQSKLKKGNVKNKHGKNKEKIKSEIETVEKSSKKKPPMRTAADVIKRLQWDKGFDKENFWVGYIDRIVGLVEKKFTAFTWGDIAAVDYYSLAIPQHRIQYFKYVTEKVWDKNERLDNVFGSTGSKITLTEAIKKYEDKQRELGENVEESSKPDVDVIENHEGCASESESEEDTVDDDEYDCSNDKVDNEKNDLLKQQSKEKRPNFFVALQITDKDTIEKLLDAQQKVITWYPSYSAHKIPANGFHLTLSLLRLDNRSDSQACFETMNQAKPKLEKLAQNVEPLTFQGLDHFSKRVVYAKVKYSKQFLVLVDEIREILCNAGIHMGSSSFKPHLTLFNVKRSSTVERKDIMLNTIIESDSPFGTQAIDNIQVCRMGTLPKGESSEFYENIFRFNINCEC